MWCLLPFNDGLTSLATPSSLVPLALEVSAAPQSAGTGYQSSLSYHRYRSKSKKAKLLFITFFIT